MSIDHTQTDDQNPLHQYGRSGSTVQHSKDRALTEREFELLLEGARQMKQSPYYYEADPELTMYALGRLGLRRGELAHLHEDWIDWRQKMIRIPAHQPCHGGKGGVTCGSCRQLAEQRVEHADGLTLEEAVGLMWTPKTQAGVREVYYGHDVRAEMYLERYFRGEYERYEASSTSISRRVKHAADHAPELDPDEIHPHGLRATAATYMAAQNVSVYQLMQYFGWQCIGTAQHYLSRNAMNTARQLRDH